MYPCFSYIRVALSIHVLYVCPSFYVRCIYAYVCLDDDDMISDRQSTVSSEPDQGWYYTSLPLSLYLSLSLIYVKCCVVYVVSRLPCHIRAVCLGISTARKTCLSSLTNTDPPLLTKLSKNLILTLNLLETEMAGKLKRKHIKNHFYNIIVRM